MIYSDTIITKKGRELIAKLQVSGATTRFSSLVLGAGTDKLTEESIQLTDQRQEFELDSAKVSLDAPDKIELTASPNNIGLESGYTIREMGIYAQDPDKGNILYAVINTEDNSATYDQFPAYSGEEDYTEIIFRMEILVANAEEVTIQMSQEAIRQQIQDLEKAINEAKNLKASLEAYGMVKLTESEAVTDSTGLALPATEKNATIEGTLANQISKLNTDMIRSESIMVAGISVPANGTTILNVGGFGNTATIACIVNTTYYDYIFSSAHMSDKDGKDKSFMRVTLHNTYSQDQIVDIYAIRIYLL